MKDRIIMGITTLFRQYEEDYYKPKRVHNFWSNNFIEYEKNGDKKGMLSLDQYLNKLEPYLRKFQLKVAINFISSKYNEEEPFSEKFYFLPWRLQQIPSYFNISDDKVTEITIKILDSRLTLFKSWSLHVQI